MLRYLFVDMNSFFASVEQQERPELRGQPIGVVPVVAQTTCCIAASYEAKHHGVRTGTAVREAKRLCPGIHLVEARPRLYVNYHHRFVEAVESCLHVDHVHSIDEVSARLMGKERQPAHARALAERVKHALWNRVGRWVRSSIGLGPNIWIAKVATDLQKPDGLSLVTLDDLPEKLYTLGLDDLPGIGRRMHKRLVAAGIDSVEGLYTLSQNQLCRIWQSRVMGTIWWQQLRGEQVPLRPTIRRTVGHSRVLPPERRTEPHAHAVLVCMLDKAAVRLRHMGYWTGSVTVSVSFLDRPHWHERTHLAVCQDTPTLLEAVNRLWTRKPTGSLLKVSVVLADLLPAACTAEPLYPHQRRMGRLSQAMDRLNAKYGPHAVYFGSMHHARGSVPTRIAFTHIPNLSLPNTT